MIRVYLPKPISGVPHIPALSPNFGPTRAEGIFAERALAYFKDPVFEIVKNPTYADYILIPHNYFSAMKKRSDYLRECERLAEESSKKLLLFAYGDSDEEIPVRNAIIFRPSQYGYKKKKNEIIMPAFVEDLSDTGIQSLLTGIESLRNKKPVVGFCGWAAFPSFQNAVKTYAKSLFLGTKSAFLRRPEILAEKKGLLFRRQTIACLQKSKLIEPNFIIRDFYSHHRDTIKISPQQARREYIENILGSDLSLAVKGDGNYSLRFYEILSLGRVPVLIDTDCVLPLENVIAYDEFILRISHRDISKADKLIAQFWNSLSEEKFIEMQKKARETFEKYLRIDAFLNYVFKDVATFESILDSQ